MSKEVTCLKCGSVIELEESDVSPGQKSVVCLKCRSNISVLGLFSPPAPVPADPTIKPQDPVSLRVKIISVSLSFEEVFDLTLKVVGSLMLIGFVLGVLFGFLYFIISRLG